MPPKLWPDGHVWADGEKGPGPKTMKEASLELDLAKLHLSHL